MSAVPAPPQASEPVPLGAAGGEDLLGVRIGAALIDLALLYGLFVVLSVTIGGANTARDGVDFTLDGADTALYVGLVLVYYFALEATIGQSVGKLLVGLRVVGRDAGRPSVAAVAIRTLLRMVDWLPALYLAGFITMLATGARRQRIGDLAARTGIGRATPIRHRGLAAAATAFTLVLAVAGSVVYVATSDEDEGAQTYRDHGVSFDYPAAWQETTSKSEVSRRGTQLWGTTVAAAELDLVLVEAYRLNPPITAENLDAAASELEGLVQQFADQLGGSVLAGPEEISVAGKPGLWFRMTGTHEGTPIEARLVFVFDGTTEYYLNCQRTAEKAGEIEQGCEQILRTFKVD
jgi:uncharacterized RDD family membrane protein YckC